MQGSPVRIGVHVGEVELTANGARGIAVHEAARITAAAGPEEILVSQTTWALSAGSGLEFEDRGAHDLKGLDGARRLFAFLGNRSRDTSR
jgi:class 3 adenylate cyclase